MNAPSVRGTELIPVAAIRPPCAAPTNPPAVMAIRTPSSGSASPKRTASSPPSVNTAIEDRSNSPTMMVTPTANANKPRVAAFWKVLNTAKTLSEVLDHTGRESASAKIKARINRGVTLRNRRCLAASAIWMPGPVPCKWVSNKHLA